MKRTSHCIDFIRNGATPSDPRVIALFQIGTRCPLLADEVRDLFFDTLRHWLSTRDGIKALSNFDGDFTLWDYVFVAGNSSLKMALFAVGITKVHVDIHTSSAGGNPEAFRYHRPGSLAA